MSNNKYLSVTALNQYIKAKFDKDPYLNNEVFLTGEVSNFRLRPTHQYFSLKDDNSRISAVMFKRAFSKVQFTLEEGMKVLVCGRVSTYPVSGQYQIYIERMEPDGVGQLYQALEQLKKKLNAEGLFDPHHKKTLPKFPKRIAVITSPSGAVIKDIIKTVRLRYPIAQIILYPTVVQGDRAADDIVKQISRVETAGNFDTLIVGRGGGSIEDLWPFNEEKVARAIYNCPIPVISSVGHQTDFTIADYVSDQRAATPTAAAEFAVPELSQVLLTINQWQNELLNYFSGMINYNQQRLQHLEQSYVFKNPGRIYEGYVQQVDMINERLINNFSNLINNEHDHSQQLIYKLGKFNPQTRLTNAYNNLKLLDQRLITSVQKIFDSKNEQYRKATDALNHFNPNRVMQRGYSYVTKDGQVVKSVDDLKLDDTVILNLYNGQVEVKVNRIKRGK